MRGRVIKNLLHKLLIPWVELFIYIFFRNDLPRYLNFVKFGKDIDCLSRFSRILVLLPLPRNSILTIQSKSFLPNFLYYSQKKDDLQYSCRLNFDEWEIISLNFFYLWAKDCKYILDVGSYSGVYAVLGALASPTAHVFAFEPNSDTRLMLSENVALNGLNSQITVERFGLGDRIGDFKLFKRDSNSLNSGASLIHSANEFEEISVIKLDNYLPDSLVNLIKIDVEGFESEVLQGGIELISRNSPVILCEALSQSDLVKQAEVLLKFGYLNPIRVSENGSDSRNFVWCTSSDFNRVNEILNLARHKFA